jgi:DNA-binding NarL/FixJ family response regulator
MYRIILADNQSIFRTGAARVLATEDRFHITAQCADAEHLQKALLAFPGVTV